MDIDAIQSFPTPSSITDIRSWFGLINQVAYTFLQSDTMASFRNLLSKKYKLFYWDQSPEQIFQKSKEEIIAMIQDGVRSFEKDRTTCLSRDLSKTGIGFTLTQKYCNFVNKSGTES